MTEYKYYRTTYGGDLIDENEWAYYENQAEATLKFHKRIYTLSVPEGETEDQTENNCICALADRLKEYDELMSEDGQVANAKIGEVSVSYGGTTGYDITEQGRKRGVYNIIHTYYDIYRGVSG